MASPAFRRLRSAKRNHDAHHVGAIFINCSDPACQAARAAWNAAEQADPLDPVESDVDQARRNLAYRSPELEATLLLIASHRRRCRLLGCYYGPDGTEAACIYCTLTKPVIEGRPEEPLASPSSGSLAETFESFRLAILEPMQAGDVQVRETRRAYYAGAAAVLDLVIKAAVELSDEKAEDYLVFLGEELRAWSEMLEEGRV